MMVHKARKTRKALKAHKKMNASKARKNMKALRARKACKKGWHVRGKRTNARRNVRHVST